MRDKYSRRNELCVLTVGGGWVGGVDVGGGVVLSVYGGESGGILSD